MISNDNDGDIEENDENYDNTSVKVKLFTAYFNNVYMCALWVNYRKTTFHQFIVAYSKSYRILNMLPMRCSASRMFSTGNVNSCTYVIRKSIDSLMTRIDTSFDPTVKSIVGAMCIRRRPSVTYGSHNCIICSFYLAQQHHAFALLLYGHIVGLHNFVYISIVWHKLLLLLLLLLLLSWL